VSGHSRSEVKDQGRDQTEWYNGGGVHFDGVGVTDMYYLLDTVPPIRIECKNVATVNIPPKMVASSVISVKVCLWTVCGCKHIANKLYRSKTN